MVGDSIGVQWYSLLSGLYGASEWRFVTLTKSACPMVDVEYFYRRIGRTYTECTVWRNAVLDYLATLKPEVVIIGSAATYDFSESQWIDGSQRILDSLSQAAGRTIIIPGTPALEFDGPGCLSNRGLGFPGEGSSESRCSQDIADDESHRVAAHLRRAAAPFDNVRVVDFNDLVCPDSVCHALSESGLIVFRDNQHLTDRYVRFLAPLLRERLTAIPQKVSRTEKLTPI